MPSQEALQEKWAPILNHEGMDSIKDNHRAMVTAQLLENQEQMLKEEREFLSVRPGGTLDLEISKLRPFSSPLLAN